MIRDLSRRLAALEARRRPHNIDRSFTVMPWDIMPDATDRDMVLSVHFVRPTEHLGGERVPYQRTGVHPAEDDPESYNGKLHRASADARPWTFRSHPSGVGFSLPHNGREPLEGGTHA